MSPPPTTSPLERLTLQIPQNQHRCNYINVKVRAPHYPDGSLAVFHGPRKLANYYPKGQIKESPEKDVA